MRLIILFSFLSAVTLSACGSSSSSKTVSPGATQDFGVPVAAPSGAFKVSLAWSTDLASGTLANSAEVRFSDANDQALAAQLEGFALFMPAMGHGTIKASELRFTQDPKDLAHWSVSQIWFSMGGSANEWVVDVTASAQGQSEKVRVPIPYEVQ